MKISLFLLILFISCGKNELAPVKFKKSETIMHGDYINVTRKALKKEISQLKIPNSFEEVLLPSNYTFEVMQTNTRAYYVKPKIFFPQESEPNHRIEISRFAEDSIKVKIPIAVVSGKQTRLISSNQNQFFELPKNYYLRDVDYLLEDLKISNQEELKTFNGCPEYIQFSQNDLVYNAEFFDTKESNSNCSPSSFVDRNGFLTLKMHKNELSDFLQASQTKEGLVVDLILKHSNPTPQFENLLSLNNSNFEQLFSNTNLILSKLTYKEIEKFLYNILKKEFEKIKFKDPIPYQDLIEALVDNYFTKEGNEYFYNFAPLLDEFSFKWKNNYWIKTDSKIKLSSRLAIRSKKINTGLLLNDQVFRTNLKLYKNDILKIKINSSVVYFKNKLSNYKHPECEGRTICPRPAPDPNCPVRDCLIAEKINIHSPYIPELTFEFKQNNNLTNCKLSELNWQKSDQFIQINLENTNECKMFKNDNPVGMTINNNLKIEKQYVLIGSARPFEFIEVSTKLERGTTHLNLDLEVLNYEAVNL